MLPPRPLAFNVVQEGGSDRGMDWDQPPRAGILEPLARTSSDEERVNVVNLFNIDATKLTDFTEPST